MVVQSSRAPQQKVSLATVKREGQEVDITVAAEPLAPGDIVLRILEHLIVTLDRVLEDNTLAELVTTGKLSGARWARCGCRSTRAAAQAAGIGAAQAAVPPAAAQFRTHTAAARFSCPPLTLRPRTTCRAGAADAVPCVREEAGQGGLLLLLHQGTGPQCVGHSGAGRGGFRCCLCAGWVWSSAAACALFDGPAPPPPRLARAVQGRGPQGAKSPLLWPEGQVEELLQGSPVKKEIAERLKVRACGLGGVVW